jgi:phosphohistidine swiveling domain-containing protein
MSEGPGQTVSAMEGELRAMATGEGTRTGFASPFEQPVPSGCEGWEEMYAPHAVFSEDRRAFDESRFWFQDGLHWAEPYHPFDAVLLHFLVVAFNQASARLFVLPQSLGTEYRFLNGYVYLTPNSVTDETALARRAELFTRRGGYYYEHWDELYARWVEKIEHELWELEALVVPELPELEDEALVREGRGWGSSHALVVAYDRLLEGADRVCQYHCEFVNLGYGAYFLFYELCRQAFPGIHAQTVARMLSGIDVVLLRPDDELRRLARLAVELGVAAAVKGAGSGEDLRGALAESEAGRRWLADFEKTKNPWFHFSYGNGMYHYHRSWIDDPTLPIATIGSYIARLEAGEDIARPYAAVLAERDRITTEYRELLQEETRQGFDEQLDLARTVFPFIENHNFYIDHWYFTLFWNKVREFGALLAEYGFLADREDVFYLRHDEVRSALEEVRLSWSSGGDSAAVRGPAYWPRIVERRKSIYEAMRRWAPPPALGRVPEEITEPVAIMLWGITTERVRAWLAASDGEGPLTGIPGSPGVATGKARVIQRPDQLGELEEGEILVAPATSPSWTPVFGTIAAAVMDTGGVMCHAAIVAREYGLPAVVGTGSATKAIKTGDRLHVDATAGVVTILD